MKRLAYLITLSGFYLLVVVPLPVLAAGAIFCTDDAQLEANGLKCLEGVFQNILKAAISLAGVLCFAFILKGGIQYTSAGGDTKAMDTARKTLTWSVTGMVAAIAGYAIINVLGQTFGITDLLRFAIP